MSQCQPNQCMEPSMYMSPGMMSPSASKGAGISMGLQGQGDMSMHAPSTASAAVPSDASMVDPYTAAAMAAAANASSQSAADLDSGEADLDDEQNGSSSNEPLACYVCRGRRMCFCYFLKVRYYKFPSFLDLVDHQYKKWRHQAAKAGRQQS